MQSGLSGVCGALSYTVEATEAELKTAEVTQRETVRVMFSVPYNLQLTSAYFAVGVDVEDEARMANETTEVAFQTMYYYAGAFTRATAGTMLQFDGEEGEDRTFCPKAFMIYSLLFGSSRSSHDDS